MRMDFQQLIDNFKTGVHWNAYLYVVYKITSTLLVFILYHKLPTNEFAAWANINSIIFLVLLWADLGLRKSIPRYCPEFLENTQANKRFINGLIAFQVLVLVALTPFVSYFFTYLQQSLQFSKLSATLPVVFFFEGILSVLRLIYHAHFKQKFFNSILSATLMLETLISIALIVFGTHNTKLVQYLFINKIVVSVLAVVVLLGSLKMLYGKSNQQEQPVDSPTLVKDFITHSGIMWLITSLRSLSERNFMVPLLTYLLGPTLANNFKVANDGALAFQRIVLKAIGTADTALLSYAHIGAQANGFFGPPQEFIKLAFRKLIRTMVMLSVPLLVFVLLITWWLYQKNIYQNLILPIFFVVSMSYLLETMLLPYERLLEIKRSYAHLLGVYLFYFFVLAIIFAYLAMEKIGLSLMVTLICSTRLISMLTMAWMARRLFGV